MIFDFECAVFHFKSNKHLSAFNTSLIRILLFDYRFFFALEQQLHRKKSRPPLQHETLLYTQHIMPEQGVANLQAQLNTNANFFGKEIVIGLPSKPYQEPLSSSKNIYSH